MIGGFMAVGLAEILFLLVSVALFVLLIVLIVKVFKSFFLMASSLSDIARDIHDIRNKYCEQEFDVRANQ